jgi:ribose 5-phosphate isomerase B
MRKQLISKDYLLRIQPRGEFRYDPERTIITEEARDFAASRGIVLVPESFRRSGVESGKEVQVVLGSDHGGFQLKEEIRAYLQKSGWRVLDVGTFSPETVDYPDFAAQVASAVSSGKAERGIMVDAVGVASAMVANRFPGVRAAACQLPEAVVSARRHNDANVLTLGGKMLSGEQALKMVRLFLEEAFEGGRHVPRVEKIHHWEQSSLHS